MADFKKAIAKAEARLGLIGQPHAVVFGSASSFVLVAPPLPSGHEKNGRGHCHVVWSRIDIDIFYFIVFLSNFWIRQKWKHYVSMKAVQMLHDREKLTPFL